ncbi:tRNA pseudouridine(55) synthase TruB [uncultured Campylobacter sp.]|uniref:tRNA pseudouridine(55) synthase TruB n=1 Tax=uncultured Campylobacter sp. TaxID=218934 RepID=UPI0026255D4D|nr:tRNA pseudouridine(55) synthase TruB [uncultured Campylobacter sp.]
MNKLFVAYKPRDISSNDYLQTLKKKYGAKKAGYAGTLDPFARGTLIVAFGAFTKLFRFLDKEPKVYECTIWLGAYSLSLDDKNIQKIDTLKKFTLTEFEKIRKELLGEVVFIPPSFSAKRINGKRAYEFAKRNEKVDLKECKMQIYESEILDYQHPFLRLRLTVSEGAYIRSYCELFANKLGINATLKELERLREGKFVYENEKELDILEHLCIKENYISDLDKLQNGTKLYKQDLKFKENGRYFIRANGYFSIIELIDENVKYIINKVEKC